MAKSSLSDILTNVELTEKQLKTICADSDVERKAAVQRQYETRQKRLKEIFALKEKRMANFAIRRKLEKLMNAGKCHDKYEKNKLQMEKIHAVDHYRKLNLIQSLKVRDRTKVENIEKLKRAKLNAKHEKEVKRYQKLIEMQKKNIELNKTCILNENVKTKNTIEEKVTTDNMDKTNESVNTVYNYYYQVYFFYYK